MDKIQIQINDVIPTLKFLLKALLISCVLVVILVVFNIYDETYGLWIKYVGGLAELLLYVFLIFAIAVYIMRFKHHKWSTNLLRFLYLLFGNFFVGLMVAIMYAYKKPNIPLFKEGVWDNEFLE